MDARVRTLSTQNNALQQQITQRHQQIGETNNVAWLEEQARRLGFVFPGETIFIITTPGSALPPGGGVNAVLPSFAPPSPSASPAASASPGSSASSSPGATPSARPSPTPLVFVMPSPTPH
ncbi:MAG: septum formation initiator family protein [Candidatus Dormibacteraeota bacterium]|nr:septum formation initiator family protein [Candidatus Dormibacteraeota bacterium]